MKKKPLLQLLLRGDAMKTLIPFIAVATLLATSVPAPAEIVYRHFGSADPEADEGWPKATRGTGCSAVAVPDDAAFGSHAAWKVDDANPSSSVGNGLNYSHDLTPALEARARAEGWILRSFLRVEDTPNTTGGAISLDTIFDTLNRRFALQFGVDGGGNTLFQFIGGSGSSVSGVGYHLYEMRFDTATETVDLFVDGDEKISDFGGANFTNSNYHRVLFGANSSGDTGTGYYNMVEFEIVPEPGSLSLLLAAAGVALLACLSRRRKRIVV